MAADQSREALQDSLQPLGKAEGTQARPQLSPVALRSAAAALS